MDKRAISKSVIKRLPIYLRILDHLIRREVAMISSRELSNESGFTAEQIRKDLAYFGAFGTRGAGYNTLYLREKIIKIIGLDQKTDIVVFGAGNLGTALTRYNYNKNPYVNLVALFDRDPRLVGGMVYDIEVMSVEKAPGLIESRDIKVAMITVPAEAAQEVVDIAVKGGIRAILNFAPVKLNVPEFVHVHNADLTIELQSLIYYCGTESEGQIKEKNQGEGEKGEKTLPLE